MTETQENSLRDLLEEHMERHPHAQPEDFYKLLYQTTFGPAHAVLTEESVFQSLAQEVQDMDLSHPHPWEDALDLLREHTGAARVHIRPYLRMGGSARRLARAMVRSAELFPSTEDPQALESFGRDLGELRTVLRASLGDLDFTGRTLDTFLHKVASERFPAIHHSDVYRETYDPHYRVVMQSAFEDEP